MLTGLTRQGGHSSLCNGGNGPAFTHLDEHLLNSAVFAAVCNNLFQKRRSEPIENPSGAALGRGKGGWKEQWVPAVPL